MPDRVAIRFDEVTFSYGTTPVLERVIAGYGGRVHLAKVEVDAGRNMKLAGHYRVRGFPTILLFEDGRERGRFHGAHPVPFVRAFLSRHSSRLQD